MNCTEKNFPRKIQRKKLEQFEIVQVLFYNCSNLKNYVKNDVKEFQVWNYKIGINN